MILFVVFQKWQRRFFILYEHGSLSFALDELVRNYSDSERQILNLNKNIHKVAVYSKSCSVYASAFTACWDQAGIFRPDVVCRPTADDLGLACPLMHTSPSLCDPLKSHSLIS